MFFKLPARTVLLLTTFFTAMTSLAWGSACSGSDIMAIAFEEIVNYSKDHFNKDLEFPHMFSSEKD